MNSSNTLSVFNFRPLSLSSDSPDNWHLKSGLHRYQCNVILPAGHFATVELVTNQPPSEFKRAPKIAALFHGFGTDAFSMKNFFPNLNVPTVCVNLLGAGNVFPQSFDFTPQNTAQLEASIIRAVAPEASHILGFGNSMGGMFMEGARLFLEKTATFHRVFINSMGTQILGGTPTQKLPEPKWSAILHTALCFAARTGSTPFITALLKATFTLPLLGGAARWLYGKHLYNKPTTQELRHHEQIMLRERPTSQSMSPIDIMTSMAKGLTETGSGLVNVKNSWESFAGPTLHQNRGRTLVASNTRDAVFGTDFERQLAIRLGERLCVLNGGAHIPDAQTASVLVSQALTFFDDEGVSGEAPAARLKSGSLDRLIA